MAKREHPRRNKKSRSIKQLQNLCRQVQGGSQKEDFVEYGSTPEGVDIVILIHLENFHIIWVFKNYFSWFSR